jgi:DedD protein
VALLTCLLAAFLSGVWIGRGADAGGAPPPPRVAQAPTPEAPLEQLAFFSEREPGARTGTPAPTATAAPTPKPATAADGREDPTAGEAMRRTLEAEVAAAREPAPVVAVAPPEPTATARATAAAPPSAAAGRFFVQVYSSTNAARAQEIVGQLRKAGFAVQLSEVVKDGLKSSRVRVGPFESRERARRPAERLRREFGLDTWVTDTP